MYLKKNERVCCFIFLAIGLLVAGLCLLAAFGEKGHSRTGPLAASAVFGALFILPTAIPLLMYYASDASRSISHRDVLRGDLRLTGLHEIRGVQFAVLPFPDEVTPPSYVGLSFFLQNCHSTPREFEVRMKRTPFRLVDRQDVYGVRLEGGESGVLNVLGLAGPDVKEGEHDITYTVHAAKPASVGKRMIREDSLRAPDKRARQATLVVHPARPAADAAYPALESRKGYSTIFRPGESALREEALAFLNLTG